MTSTKRAARRRSDEPPEGFRYLPDLLAEDEERELLDVVRSLPFETVLFRGYEAKRRVVHLGHRYDFEARGVDPGLPIPSPLLELRERLAPIGGRAAERYEEVLVTEYRPGAAIGWHRDAPAFGSTVLGVSLHAACRMRFRRSEPEGWLTWEEALEPRSAYLLSGPARALWQHSIPPVAELRYSITYRTVRTRHRSGTS
jgi:alkylated DNA repair dioxygenase AlkB